MSRKTAVTEIIPYSTQNCEICSESIVIDEVPDDSDLQTGYLVILGEGELKRKIGKEGNWDEEFQFTLSEEDDHLPEVGGYIICDVCAEAIHGYPPDREPYIGTLPRELTLTSGGNTDAITNESSIIVYVIVVLILIVLLLLLLLL